MCGLFSMYNSASLFWCVGVFGVPSICGVGGCIFLFPFPRFICSLHYTVVNNICLFKKKIKCNSYPYLLILLGLQQLNLIISL